MKRHLKYDEMTELLDSKMSEIESGNFDEIICIVRGGLTPGQYVATQLRLPVGVYYPSNHEYLEPRLILSKKKSRNLLFVEDLVSRGRTYRELERFMSNKPEFRWDFLPVFTDWEYPDTFDLCPLKTKDWIAMPYEKLEHIKEGGRGLFRLNEDGYKR